MKTWLSATIVIYMIRNSRLSTNRCVRKGSIPKQFCQWQILCPWKSIIFVGNVSIDYSSWRAQQAYKIDLCELSQFVSFFSLFLLQKNSKQRWRSGIHAKPKGFILEATKNKWQAFNEKLKYFANNDYLGTLQVTLLLERSDKLKRKTASAQVGASRITQNIHEVFWYKVRRSMGGIIKFGAGF